MKRKPLKSMAYKDEMGFVCLNTRYVEMRHFVSASLNGTETQRKTVTEEEGDIRQDANIYSACGQWSKRVNKARGEIQGVCFPLITPCPDEAWLKTCGYAAQLWEVNLSMGRPYPQIIKTPTNPYEEELKR